MLPTGVETKLKLATCHSKVDVQETGIGGTERRFIQKTSNLEDGELASQKGSRSCWPEGKHFQRNAPIFSLWVGRLVGREARFIVKTE